MSRIRWGATRPRERRQATRECARERATPCPENRSRLLLCGFDPRHQSVGPDLALVTLVDVRPGFLECGPVGHDVIHTGFLEFFQPVLVEFFSKLRGQLAALGGGALEQRFLLRRKGFPFALRNVERTHVVTMIGSRPELRDFMETKGERQVEAVVLSVHLTARQCHVHLVESERYDFDADGLERLAEDRDRWDAQAHPIEVLGLEDRPLGGHDGARAAVAPYGKNAHAGRLRTLLIQLLENGTIEPVFGRALALEKIRQIGNVERPAALELSSVADPEIGHVDRAKLHARYQLLDVADLSVSVDLNLD